MIEEWRDINGFEGKYQASSLGRIRSLKFTFIRSNGRKYTQSERVKKLTLGLNGYLFFTASGYPMTAHRAVALTFNKNKNKKNNFVDHLDENKLNNLPSNLEWVTSSENAKRWFRNNPRLGEKSASSKLKRKQVISVKRMFSKTKGMSVNKFTLSICKEYGVNRTTISDILKGRTWSHVR